MCGTKSGNKITNNCVMSVGSEEKLRNQNKGIINRKIINKLFKLKLDEVFFLR